MKHSFHLKHLGAVFLGLALPALALAQNAAPAKSTSAKTDAKPAAKTATTNKAAPAPKTAAKKADPASSRTQLKSAAVNVAAGIRAAEAALTPEELAIAERVYTGHMPCELGNSVSVTRDAGRARDHRQRHPFEPTAPEPRDSRCPEAERAFRQDNNIRLASGGGLCCGDEVTLAR